MYLSKLNFSSIPAFFYTQDLLLSCHSELGLLTSITNQEKCPMELPWANFMEVFFFSFEDLHFKTTLPFVKLKYNQPAKTETH